jgi:DNA-binding NarL/FixJ family response regulator
MVADAIQRRERADRRNALEMSILMMNPAFADVADVDPDGSRMAASLTPREREVVGCIADAMENAAISEHLGIAIETVKRHLSTVCDKWGVDKRLEIGVAVYRRPALRVVIPIPSEKEMVQCL